MEHQDHLDLEVKMANQDLMVSLVLLDLRDREGLVVDLVNQG